MADLADLSRQSLMTSSEASVLVIMAIAGSRHSPFQEDVPCSFLICSVANHLYKL